jgi:hypothetical protein
MFSLMCQIRKTDVIRAIHAEMRGVVRGESDVWRMSGRSGELRSDELKPLLANIRVSR